MAFPKKSLGPVIVLPFVVVGGLLTAAMLFTTDWDRPPIDSEQVGYRGTGMAILRNPRKVAEAAPEHAVLEEPWELELPEEGEELAGDIYENVQVLGHLGDDQFNRLMTAITEWVSPEEGCTYCHNAENFADDTVYTKIVARRMIQMNQTINAEWPDHVAPSGVTCYTCHRGQNIPAEYWASADIKNTGMAGYDFGQNKAEASAVFASLPYDPFTPFLLNNEPIRVQSGQTLPDGTLGVSIKNTEYTYSLMNHMSDGLGVNCSYCHNTRAFGNWEESPPVRMKAWYGIRMARSINVDYMQPLSPVYPAHRVGPLGDAFKANCATCHQGVAKPLYGEPMAEGYPSLLSPAPAN